MNTKQLVLAEKDIQKRVSELGRQISNDYSGKKLLIVGVLKGAFIFMADLARAIDLPLRMDFVQTASYGMNSESSGKIILKKDVDMDISGCHVLLVEDIVDTGLTMTWLRDHYIGRNVASVKVCTLIDKTERRENPVTIDYSGFTVEQGFLVGYGLDFQEEHRHYPEVYSLQATESDE